VIEEIKKPPPPPEVVLPPPPKLEAPPPPFIPPPEIQIATPPPPRRRSPPRRRRRRPRPWSSLRRRRRSSPPRPRRRAARPVSAGVVCSNYQSVMGDVAYPREAQRAGIEKGEALIQFTLSPTGEVKDIKVIRASHQIFARNSVRIVGEYKCQGQGREVTVQVPFGYKLQ
jgi:protein TonB